MSAKQHTLNPSSYSTTHQEKNARIGKNSHFRLIHEYLKKVRFSEAIYEKRSARMSVMERSPHYISKTHTKESHPNGN